METSLKTTIKYRRISSSLFLTYLHTRSYAVIKGLSFYQHVTKSRCLIKGMLRNVQNVTKSRCLIQGMSRNVQNVTEWRCLIYGLQQNATKYNGIYLPCSPKVTEYRSRNNEMLQTDLVTYIW